MTALQARGHWFEPSCAHQEFLPATGSGKRGREQGRLPPPGSGALWRGREGEGEVQGVEAAGAGGRGCRVVDPGVAD